jgi:DHA1 family tetracycline resistance protein-like MFS transporter
LASSLGERAPFWVGAAVTSVTVLLTVFGLDESLTAEERAARRQHGRKMTAADVSSNIPLLLILLIGFGAQFSFALFQSSFSLFGAAVLFPGHSTQEATLGVGLLLTGIGIGQFVTQLWLIQPLVRRYGERRLVIIGDLLRAFGVLTLTLFTSPWLVGPISLIAFAVGSGLMMPSLQSLATVTVHDELRGGVLGLYQSATSLGVILGAHSAECCLPMLLRCRFWWPVFCL